MQRVFLILILIITGIYTASCGELNTIHFPGDILTNTCKEKSLSPIKDEQGLIDMKAGGQYCLTQNINIDTWDEKQQPFTGIFDGNNKTITINTIDGNSFIQQIGNNATFKNVNINIKNINPDPTTTVGALARINYGTIQGVTLNNVTVSGSGEVGGLVGKNEGEITNVTLNNVTVNGSGEVGGLVGKNEGTIQNAKVVSRSITAAGQGNVGGLVGKNDNFGKSITNSHANTNITYPGGDGINVGGFIGLQVLGTITKCSSAGKLTRGTTTTTGSNDPPNLGGFIGKLSGDGTIQKSYTMTNITFGGSNINVGGFIGYQYQAGSSNTSNCYSAGKLTIESYSAGSINLGGFIGYQEFGDISAAYTRSKFVDKKGGLIGTISDIKAGHFIGRRVGGGISGSFYIETNSNITKAVGESASGANTVAPRNLKKVQVANGEPENSFHSQWSLGTTIWTIEKGKWPTLKNNPE